MIIDTSGIPYWTAVNITIFWVVIGLIIALVIFDILLSVFSKYPRNFAGFFTFIGIMFGGAALVGVFAQSSAMHSAVVQELKVVEISKLGYTDVDLAESGKFTANQEGAFVRGFLDYKGVDTYEVYFVGGN